MFANCRNQSPSQKGALVSFFIPPLHRPLRWPPVSWPFPRHQLPRNIWGAWETGAGPQTPNVLCDLGHVPASLCHQILGYSLQPNTQWLGCGQCGTLNHLLACLFQYWGWRGQGAYLVFKFNSWAFMGIRVERPGHLASP